MSDQYVLNDLQVSRITEIDLSAPDDLSNDKTIIPLGPTLDPAYINVFEAEDTLANLHVDGHHSIGDYKISTPQGTFALSDFVEIDNGTLRFKTVNHDGESIVPKVTAFTPISPLSQDMMYIDIGNTRAYINLAGINTIQIDPGISFEIDTASPTNPTFRDDSKMLEIDAANNRTYPKNSPGYEPHLIDFDNIAYNNLIEHKDPLSIVQTSTVEERERQVSWERYRREERGQYFTDCNEGDNIQSGVACGSKGATTITK